MSNKGKSIYEMIARRKDLWEKSKCSIKVDRAYVEAIANELTSKDTQNSEQNIENRKLLRDKPYLLIELAFTVINKKAKEVPFFLNEVQKEFVAEFIKNEQRELKFPIFILKGRQQGFTTLITAIQLSYCIIKKNFAGFTIADCDENAKNIFREKAKSVFDRLPEKLKPEKKLDSARQLYFNELNSFWGVSPAVDNVGVSRTIHFVHMSEAALYKSLSNLQSGLLNATTEEAIVIYETTARGYNEAKILWDSETCVNLFYEWWKSSEYNIKDIKMLERERWGKLETSRKEWLEERIKWLKDKLIPKYGEEVALRKIAWYCKEYISNAIDRNKIKQEYPCFPEEAFIASGNCVFDAETIQLRIDEIRTKEPEKQGYFRYKYDGLKLTDIRWVNDKNGAIKIFKDKPDDESPYVIGGDTAGEGSDWFIGQVLDNTTGEQVALLRHQTDEDLYAKQLYCLGKYFNNALIGVEVNYSRKPVKDLNKWGYPKQFLREKYDQISKQIEMRFGFQTSQITRRPILEDLVEIARENPHLINDVVTLREMLAFVSNETGKWEASSGSHDDCVMALAIAYFIRPQQSTKKLNNKEEKKKNKKIYRKGKRWIINE